MTFKVGFCAALAQMPGLYQNVEWQSLPRCGAERSRQQQPNPYSGHSAATAVAFRPAITTSESQEA